MVLWILLLMSSAFADHPRHYVGNGPIPSSGYKYSELTRMRINGGSFFGSEPTDRFLHYWWSFQPADLGSPKPHPVATIHWSTPNDYQEDFLLQGQWITVDNWSIRWDNNLRIKYKVETTFAELTFNPDTDYQSKYYLTELFLNGPHPYVLEAIPSIHYRLVVRGNLIRYDVNAETGAEVKNEATPPHPFQWTVDYFPPAPIESLFFGTRMGIVQSEEWSDSAGVVRQQQSICDGIGYLCRSVRNDGTVLGVTDTFLFEPPLLGRVPK